ncbi:MAG: serine/threonine protein phosphatase [Rhodospirillaceae bacterium]|nr:serine/threonine protein phosphatase [Rhodospirillaceae bacterium]MBL6941258.1 serine/threonine protein phosphatase [Rhodospirillales bacterium]
MTMIQQDIIPTYCAVPPGKRLYAIGDIHGRYDLLKQLLEMIRIDAGTAPAGFEKVLIFLGDYVDRGADSKRVLEHLSGPPPAGFTMICLKGNHEDMLLQFLDGEGAMMSWLKNGGRETLKSYGLNVKNLAVSRVTDEIVENARRELRAAIPGSHLEFLCSLDLIHLEGDFAFAHAGIKPGVSLATQKELDLIWIRDEFLKSDADFGKVIIHGHSVTSLPSIKANRIGIDTGAWRTDVLTCLALEGQERRFLHT